MKRGVLLLAALCFALLSGSIGVPNLNSGEIFAVPVSDQIVMGTMTLPNGRKVQFGSREGTMVTIQDRSSGYFVGFVSKLYGHSTDKVTVRVFKIVQRTEEGFEGAYQILDATRVISVGAGTEVATEFGLFKLSIDEIVLGEFPGLMPLSSKGFTMEIRQSFGKTGGGTCCIGCGGIAVCGSEVSAECGSCAGGGRRAV